METTQITGHWGEVLQWDAQLLKNSALVQRWRNCMGKDPVADANMANAYEKNINYAMLAFLGVVFGLVFGVPFTLVALFIYLLGNQDTAQIWAWAAAGCGLVFVCSALYIRRAHKEKESLDSDAWWRASSFARIVKSLAHWTSLSIDELLWKDDPELEDLARELLAASARRCVLEFLPVPVSAAHILLWDKEQAEADLSSKLASKKLCVQQFDTLKQCGFFEDGDLSGILELEVTRLRTN